MKVPATTLLLAVALLLGCAPIDALGIDACGNNVVEPDNGEDCDLIEDPALGDGLLCGPPNSGPAECRYVCDGADCPVGWACDDDGICRAPSGLFEGEDEPSTVLRADEIALADVLGDEAAELVVRLDGELFVFGDEDGIYARRAELSLLNPRGELAFADVDGDELLDILVPAAQRGLDLDAAPQVHVLRSDAERLESAVVPQVFSEKTVLSAAAVTTGDPLARELMLLVAGRNGSVLARVQDPSCANVPSSGELSLSGLDRAQLLPPRTAAHPSGGQAIVTAVGSRTVERLGLQRICGPNVCAPATAAVPCAISVTALQTVELPAPVAAPGCLFIDVNGDGDLALLCHTEGGGLILAAGENDAWVVDPALSSRFSGLSDLPRGQARACAPALQILAVADLDGQPGDDIVTAHGAFLADEGGYRRVFARTQGDAWGEAVAGDFDRDGRMEVVATVARAASLCATNGMQHLAGTDGAFSESLVVNVSEPQRLRGGDFDGDGIDDVAVVEHIPEAVQVSVLFGDTKEALEDKSSVGGFDTVNELVALPRRDGSALNDELVGDLVIVSDGGEFLTSVSGTTRRSLLSPLEFEVDMAGASQVVTLAGTLGPRAPSPDDDPPAPDILTIAGPNAWLLRDEDVHHGDEPLVLELDAFGLHTECSAWAVGTPSPTGSTIFAGIDGHQPRVLSLETSCVTSAATPTLVVGRFAGTRDATVLHIVRGTVPNDLRAPTTVAVFDFDGTGADDVFVHFAMSSEQPRGRVVWIRDPDPDAAESGPLQFDPLLADVDVLGIAAVNTDRDALQELVALTPQGLLVLDYDAHADSAMLVGEPQTGPPLAAAGSAPILLASGDLDGDDLTDIAILVGDAIYLYPALPSD